PEDEQPDETEMPAAIRPSSGSLFISENKLPFSLMEEGSEIGTLLTTFKLNVINTDNETYEIIDGFDDELDLSKIENVFLYYELNKPNEPDIVAGSTNTFDLPEFFEGNASNVPITVDGETVAHYSIEDGKLIVTFTEKVNGFDDVKMEINLGGEFKTEIFEKENEITITIPYGEGGSYTATIRAKQEDYDAEDKKTAGDPYVLGENDEKISVDRDPEFIDWTVVVNDAMEDYANAIVFDHLGDHLEIDLTSIKVNKLIRNYKNVTIEKIEVNAEPTLADGGFEVALGDISHAYEITYTTRVIRPEGGGPHTITNSAGLKYDDGQNDILPVAKDLTWSGDLPTIAKNGELSTDPETINWEVRYNLNMEDFGEIVLTDNLDFGEIDTDTIKVYQVTEVNVAGEIVEKTELADFQTGTDDDGNITFELDAKNKAYFITFSSSVPVGLKGDVTNTITDNWSPNPNFASDSVPVDTIPTGGKIGQQKVDSDGNPYIEWTITLNSERVSVGSIRLADIFDQDLLSFDPTDHTLYELYRYANEGSEGALIENGYSVASYTDPDDSDRSGFQLHIDDVGSYMYKFVYRTYYTMAGMQEPHLANEADIFFINEDGTGIGNGETPPIIATLEGPISSIRKLGWYSTSNDETTQTIQWRFVLNESKIKLDKTKTEIVDSFTSKNYEYIEDSFIVKDLDQDKELTKGVDYSFDLTSETVDEETIQNGFKLELLKNTNATLEVTYRTTVDDDANQDHVNDVSFTWQGRTEKAKAIVE
ncbi:MAG: hypothetical protein GX777_08650, partial [Fastidiosipila sp.]|nr:hypothetical protein [Fastidiosipila sp.]